jgi:hypothetical protein
MQQRRSQPAKLADGPLVLFQKLRAGADCATTATAGAGKTAKVAKKTSSPSKGSSS